MDNLHLYQSETQVDAQVSYYSKIKKIIYKNNSYAEHYLTIKTFEKGTISFVINKNVNTRNLTNISYSTNNGITWNTTQNTDNKSEDIQIIVNVNRGDEILWKGNAKSLLNAGFLGTVKFKVEGNIMSLLYEDNFISKNTLLQSQTFMHLFEDTQIINARNLILPATKLINNCYSSMFSGCTSLTLAPAELPATTLANNCYVNMFSGCTSLSTAPELPATTLANNCYDHMFGGCTSLTTAPELPATKLVYGCYSNMFNGCTNLNYIKAMFTTTPSTTYTQNWVKGVASTGTFVKNSAATWDVTGIHGIPTGWTVEYPAILYFDDFPNNDDDNIWDEYDDIVARSIEDPEGMQCNKMKYMGQTIEIDGQTYYIWEDFNSDVKILTNTVDSDILTSQSLAANYQRYVGSGDTISEDEQNLVNDITFDSLYGGIMFEDELYAKGYDSDWVQKQRLVKYIHNNNQ